MLLHELIQSMSKAEKRYFKLYVRIGKKNPPRYVQLFDAIKKQSEYDEQALKDKGFTSDDKNLLTEKILDTLHIMQLHKSVDAELCMMLSYFNILHQKRQWNLLGKYIKRAKKTARDNERFTLLLDIIKWEQNLIFKTIKNDFYDTIDTLVKEKKAVTEQLDNELAYSNLCMQIDALLVTDKALSKPENETIFQRLINSPLLHQQAKPLSKKATIDYCYVKSIYHKYANEMDKVYHYYQLILEIFDKNEFLFHIPEYTAFYVKIWFWEKTQTMKLKKPSDKTVIQLLEGVPLDSLDVSYNIHLQSLTYCVRTLNKTEGEQLIAQAEQQWEHYTKHIKETRLSTFSYTIMIFYCMFEEWNKAQKWLDKVTAVNRMTDRKDVQVAARIWQLVICYELDSSELDKHIQSAYKYFVRNEYYFEVEQHILQAFRELQKALDYREEKGIWENLIHAFDTTLKNEVNTRRGLNNLKLWCESKIARTNMTALIEQQDKYFLLA